MDEYGVAPVSDEAEITTFGPGYGEAIAIHIGAENWILIDSCVHPDSKQPASLHYLTQIGVSADKVRLIVASHWHDDHTRGLAELVRSCPNASVFVSGVFNDREAITFVCAYGSDIAAGQSRGTRELFNVVNSRDVEFAYIRSLLLETTIHGRIMRVFAFSPTARAQQQTLRRLASYLPQAQTSDMPINHAPQLHPNVESVVLHVDFGDDSALLGSDMENAGETGWNEIIADAVCVGQRKATNYKVAHHGSKSGHADGIWSKLLTTPVVSVMTPFVNGSHALPDEEDRKRIRMLSKDAYITSAATKKPKVPAPQLKRMQDICKNLARVNPGFGTVRLRRRLGTSSWNVETFGDAQRI